MHVEGNLQRPETGVSVDPGGVLGGANGVTCGCGDKLGWKRK